MPQRLRQEFSLKNPDLELLNYRFAVTAIGVKVYSYIETRDTELQVLSTGDSAGETLTSISLCIVDGRSAKLGTTDIPVEDEEVIPLNSTHTGAPKFSGEDILHDLFIDELASLIQGFSADERAAYQNLTSGIMTDLKVDIHQFYESRNAGKPTSMKVWSEYPSLKLFFDLGPTACLDRRLDKLGSEKQGLPNGISKPKIEIEYPAPTINVAFAPPDESQMLRKQTSLQILTIPNPTEPPKIFHQRRPPLSPSASFESERPSHLSPHQPIKGNNNENSYPKSHEEKPLQHRATYKLPSQASDRFKWIHVPTVHCGWVPVRALHNCLTTSYIDGFLSMFSQRYPRIKPIWTCIQNFCLTKYGNHSTIDLGMHPLMLDIYGHLSNFYCLKVFSSLIAESSLRIGSILQCTYKLTGTPYHRLEGPLVPSSATDEVQLVVYVS